jgi:hypothetical protein
MRKVVTLFLGFALLIGFASVAGAQQKASPHESVKASVGQANIVIEYGRPYVKGRDVYNPAGSLAPLGKVWRTGADEATKLTTDRDLMIGSLHVPAGSYSLFTIPGKEEWTLIVNKVDKQWGAYKYDEKMDLGRVKMKAAALSAPVEQLTIEIKPSGAKGTLSVSWEKMSASIPVMAH